MARLRTLIDFKEGDELIYDDGNRTANIKVVTILIPQKGKEISCIFKNISTGKEYKVFGYEISSVYKKKLNQL